MRVRDLRGDIRLEQVRFTYASGGIHRLDPPPVLDGIDIQVRAGDVVGLMGPSGCGKSTLFRLLLGFERPTQGRILFDGRDLANLDLHSLRRRIGVVLQHGQLIPGTLMENILAGEASWSEEDAWAAARMACIDKDIEAMPMGMHTFVSEGGRNLSVGQRQRVLIARALAKRPSVLLLDEATSAIDNRVQTQLMNNILSLGATCVVSSHRLTAVRAASRLVVLEKGRVVQEGTYQQLLAEKGPFAGLAGRPA
jgi:ATP-binding cassette subfamily C protein